MKFNIGAVSPKTYKHRYNSFNVTTCNPIFVQPTFFRVVMPNSKINCTFKQTLRTLPMPFPSFANVKICNKAFFVPIEDICDNFANLMSEKPYNTVSGSYVPKNLPFVSCTILTDNIIKNPLFCTSKYLQNIVGSAGEAARPAQLAPAKSVASTSFDYNERFAPLFDNIDLEKFAPCDNLSISKFLELRNQFIINGVDYFDTERVQAILDHKRGASSSRPLRSAAANGEEQHHMSELDGYDYVNVYNSVDMSDTIHDAQGIHLTAQGAAVVKILNGLGYKFTRFDDTKVNLMPLIAFYKCWFESFYPSRLEDFQETTAGKLIKKFQENQIDFTKWDDPKYSEILYEFIDSLGKCFVSNPTDFASMHMSTLNNGQSVDVENLSVFPSLNPPYLHSVSSLDPSNDAKVPALDPSTSTAYDVKFLLWLQKYVNRDSIIGNRIDLWMRSHLNSDVYSRLVARSKVLGYSEFPVNIGDVDSTAQTTDLTANEGAPLGAYAGKAVGSGEFKFKGSFNTYGFVIVLSWYDCSTDVTQCVDPQLFATNKWTIPQAELDCMGYEVTPKSAFFTDNGICPKGMKLFKDDSVNDTKGFGFVPRLSGFKTFRPIVNGDLARRSMQNSYLPFVNRRYLINNRYRTNGEGLPVQMLVNKLPIASARWRWQNAEPLIGGYDNIFSYNNWSVFSNSGFFDWGFDTSTAQYVDNIILYTSIDLMEVNPLKPLSNSYDTDILKDDGELTVNNN
nr:MAG: major capsid protein [Microviridae sp.]